MLIGFLDWKPSVFFTLTPRSIIYTLSCGRCQALCRKIGEVLYFGKLNCITELITEQVRPMADNENIISRVQFV